MTKHRAGTILAAALVYFGVVFAVAFAIGALRVGVLVPRIGALAAVALEVPVLLILSWVMAGRVQARWPLSRPDRAAMGALAFVMLMLAEYALGVLAFGQTAAAMAAAMATPAGALGLAGQIGFALMPVLRR